MSLFPDNEIKDVALQPLFISIDPERDDVKAVAAYVKGKHPPLRQEMGLSGFRRRAICRHLSRLPAHIDAKKAISGMEASTSLEWKPAIWSPHSFCPWSFRPSLTIVKRSAHIQKRTDSLERHSALTADFCLKVWLSFLETAEKESAWKVKQIVYSP